MNTIGYMLFGGFIVVGAYLLIIIDKLKEIIEILKKEGK